jgi:hypothetical protein
MANFAYDNLSSFHDLVSLVEDHKCSQELRIGCCSGSAGLCNLETVEKQPPALRSTVLGKLLHEFLPHTDPAPGTADLREPERILALPQPVILSHQARPQMQCQSAHTADARALCSMGRYPRP